MVDNSEDESSDENSHFNKSKKKQDKSLYCYHCGLIFPNKDDLLQHFAKVYGSTVNINSTPENKVTSSQANNFKINNKNDKSFQATDADKKYLCVLCKMAFTKSGSKSHRKLHHPDLPKYSRIHEAILIEKDTKTVDTSKIIEGNKDTRKRHIISDEKSQVLTKSKSDEEKGNTNQDGRQNEKTKKRKPDEDKDKRHIISYEKSQVLTKSKSDEEQGNTNQDGRENETTKKRKPDEDKDNEHPSIFKCKRCSLSFVSAETIGKHFKECQTSSRSSKICDACGLKFTKDELISHVFKHHVTNKNYKKFCILVVSNVTFVENNYGILKENISPSKTNTDITESSEDEFEPKKNLGKAPRHELNKQSKMKTNETQVTNSNESQTITNTQQDSNLNQSTQKCTCSKVIAQNCLKPVNPTKQPFKVISHHPKRRYSYDGFSIDNEKEVTQRDPNSLVQRIDTMETTEIQTQIEVQRDINTNDSKTSPVNSNVDLNLTKKPLKISKNPRRRLTYHDGLTFSQCSLAEHCNTQLIGESNHVGRKTFVTSAEVHSYGEKGRVQIATGKTCAEIRLEKNINVTNITKVNTQTYGAIDERRNSHTENTISEPNGEQKHAYTNIANNTQSEIDISRVEEEVFKLFKCSECNVCYLSSSACDTHMRDHKPTDPADFSKCNDCGFVFTNDSLGDHKNNCPGHNIDKVIVDEYRLVVKDDKVVRDVYQYVIQRQCDKEKNSISTPGIVNSDTTYGSDGKQLNADNSRFDLADNDDAVEKNMNVTENNPRNNLHNVIEDIRQIRDGKETGKSPNFVKDIEGESNLQSNEMVRLCLSNKEAEATLAGTRNTEESFIYNSRETNNAACVEKKKDVGNETTKINTYVEHNQQNEEVQGVVSKEGRCSTFENYTPNNVSDQQREKSRNDALIPQTSFEVPTVIENNETSQQIITSPKSAEFLESRGVANGAESVHNAGEELTKHDDSTTEHVGEIAIVKTETITEDNINTGEGLNMTQPIVEIFDNYFEDQNTVTVIDSDDDSDCQIVYVEKKRSRRNTKQRINHMITFADELSSSSEKTMILEYEENHAYSLQDFIKSEL